MPLSYIEISKENLISNIKCIHDSIHDDVKIAAVVKANAYGHGLKEVAESISDHIDYFQVDDIDELRKLRELTSKPILVLGYVDKEHIREMVKLEGTMSLFEIEQIKELDADAKEEEKNVNVHVAIDALLGREGVLLENLDSFLSMLSNYSNIRIEGAYAHFANIEDTSDFSHAQKQIDVYNKALKIFSDNGYSNLITHISATSGILAYEKDSGKNNLIRLGIGIYGIWPSEDLKARFGGSFQFKPVLRWISHVGQIKTLPANYTIGYGLTYITSKETKIALIPQGYSDGYDRRLSNIGEVLIHGKRCKILGRIAMNMFVVDVSKIDDVAVEDEVVLLGNQGDDFISSEEIASKLGSINYEFIARISPLLPRVVI